MILKYVPHIIGLLAVCLILLVSAGCGPEKLDKTAKQIVISDLSQLESETFEGFTALEVLDLRNVEADEALVKRLSAALPGRRILWMVPLGSEAFDSGSQTLTLPAGTAASDLRMLAFFPDLTVVDATLCAVDGAFAEAAAAYPSIRFSWNAQIYGVLVQSGDTFADLSGSAETDFGMLGPLLAGLPALERVDLTDTAIGAQQIASLEQRYPFVTFDYDVVIGGIRASVLAESLDLTQAALSDTASLQSALMQFSALKSVDLQGQAIGFDEMDSLVAAFPDIAFSFSFELFSQQLTTAATRLELDGYPLSSPEEFASVMKYLPNLTYADLCGCGLTNGQMEQLIAHFPDVKFVWLVRIGAWEVRSDITAFSKGNRDEFPNGMGRLTDDGPTNFYNEDIEPLKYCTDLIYLDLGHGNRISDLSVLTNLKKLRVLIVSMNKIVDISPLAALTELECLEIYQNPITDISVVASLPKLKYLNCSSIKITDASPLHEMKQLEMLWFVHNLLITKEQRQQLEAALPDCNICFSANSSGEGGWTENGLYIEYQTAFGLPYN